MKKITPFNNIVLCQLLEKEQKPSGIVLPNTKEGRFIRIKIIDRGGLVNRAITLDSICIANNLFELIDPAKPDIGFINEKDILAREDMVKES